MFVRAFREVKEHQVAPSGTATKATRGGAGRGGRGAGNKAKEGMDAEPGAQQIFLACEICG